MYGPHTNERLGRTRDRRPPRRGLPGDEVRDQARSGRQPVAARDRRQRGLRARGLRGLAGASRRRAHRPLLPAPRRSQDADRGDRRGDGGARQGGQGPSSGPLRGGARDDPPRARRAPDRGCPDRVLAVDARRRGGDPADAERARDRARRVLAARSRLPRGSLHLQRGARRGRLPSPRAALHGRERRAQPRAGRPRAGAGTGEGRHAGPARARVGPRSWRAHRSDPRDQAADATSKRTSPRPRSS